MKLFSFLIICLLVILESNATTTALDQKCSASEGLETSPLLFRENRGQWNNQILYRGNSQGNIYFMKDGLSFGQKRTFKEKGKYEYLVWNVIFGGSNKNVTVEVGGKKNSKTNYLFGKDKAKHIINTPEYSDISYIDIYDKIDLHYYSINKQLKYDYILHPGADITEIKMICKGIKSLQINEQGQLEIETVWGKRVEAQPYTYQKINGHKQERDIRYRLINDSTYGFESFEAYDPSKTLIIDPVVLEWSTYVIGLDEDGDGLQLDIAVDDQGYVYGVGIYNDYFPVTPGIYDSSYNGGSEDVFVYKLNPDASSLIYATYIGGSSADGAFAIELNNNEIYIGGTTSSNDFPTTSGAYDESFNGVRDVFFCKLSIDGVNISYSTFLGGDSIDGSELLSTLFAGAPCDIKVNLNGEVFIAGYTMSADFPVTSGVLQNTLNGASDVFISRINPLGNGVSDLVYSTYLGGSAKEGASVIGFFETSLNIAIDTNNHVFVTGSTESSDFPTTTNILSGSFGGGVVDAFIFELDPFGAVLINSSYLGGNNFDAGTGIAIGSDGAIFVTGMTISNDFPTTPGAFDISANGNIDIFVSKIKADFSGFDYSTYIGGTFNEYVEYGHPLALNDQDEVFLSATTMAPPLFTFPISPCPIESFVEQENIFVLILDESGSKIKYSSSVSGDDSEFGTSIVVKKEGCDDVIYVGASTQSTDFPTTLGVFKPIGFDNSTHQPVAFKLVQRVQVAFTYIQQLCNLEIAFTDTTRQCGLWDSTSNWEWDFGDGSTSTIQNPVHVYSEPGTYNVKLRTTCPYDSIIIAVNVDSNEIAQISSDTSICKGDSVQLSVSGGLSYFWNPSIGLNDDTLSSPKASPATTTKYTVIVTDTAGCQDTASVYVFVQDSIQASITGDSIICVGETVQLLAIGGSAYQWTPNIFLNYDNIDNPIVSPDSTMNYSVIVEGGLCPADTAYFTIKVNALPNINAMEDTTIVFGESIILVASGAVDYQWATVGSLICSNCINPSVSPVRTTTYTVSTTDTNDCVANDSVTINILTSIYLPNAFSPNGNGGNDMFRVRGAGIDNIIIKIFDRWGNRVFETTDLSEAWDGKNNKGLDMGSGVYVYYLTVSFIDGKEILRKGNVSLIR